MARIPRILITGDPSVYHVISRTALDGFPLADIENDFLVEQINTISGISTARDELEELVQAPLARACFVLAKTFGWTPEEVSGLTIGQILLYLEMARRDGETV